MGVIEFGSSLNLDEVVNATKQNLEDHVVVYYGKIVENTMINEESNKLKLLINTVAGNICKNIHEKWNTVENISIIQRINDENIIICISSNIKKLCLAALNYAVNVFSELWQACMEQLEIKDDLETLTKQEDFQQSEGHIPPHMIQIQATNDQINKRIESFIERKREQVNMSNVKDFCIRGEESDMCARVDAVLCRRKDSKSHIQVRRVINDCGPQMWSQPNCIQNEESQDSLTQAIGNATRFNDQATTQHGKRITLDSMKIKQEPESLSTVNKTLDAPPSTSTSTESVLKPFKVRKRTFTVADIDSKLDILKRRVAL